jgi:hypothetical protein
MQSIWKLWVTAKTEPAARRVYSRLIDRMAHPASVLSIEPYPKTGGFIVAFQIILASQEWNDAVVEVIALGQRVAYGWYITGSILEDSSATSNKVSVAGATMVEWQLIYAQPRSDEQN